MEQLSLAGLSDDGRRLLLVDSHGTEYTLEVDARLRAALRGEHARLGELEIKMESTLRPRDIQSRIRAGDTVEAVAQAANTTVDKIEPYAAPVLAERAHVARRAQLSSLRRRTEGIRTLGDAVAWQVREHGAHPEDVAWDAWRREDGRWALSAEYAAGRRKGTAKFTFDLQGNYVVSENDDARWLIGDAVSMPTEPEPRDDLRRVRERRLAPADELPLGDDVIGLVNEPATAPVVEPAEALAEPAETTEERTVDLSETAAAVRRAGGRDDADLQPTPEPLADEPATHTPDETGADDEAEKPKPQARPRKKGRASVPSWDEIMFGGKQD